MKLLELEEEDTRSFMTGHRRLQPSDLQEGPGEHDTALHHPHSARSERLKCWPLCRVFASHTE
ncbi:hypothetical protein MDA_GLEAN10007643 [Myotis davidii]|uniref:Uncharacterized protein n=1 Tax=Myotis davidii TaxID=225400 RepID=L5LLX6_MYODS|nr:hypothetical protein MDA_GLEAN10007643 [Myotis davidii]